MRRPRIITLVVAGIIAASLLDHARNSTTRRDDYSRYHNRTARVLHAIDAATIEVDLPDSPHPTTLVHLCGVAVPDESADEIARRWLRDETARTPTRLLLDERRPLRDSQSHLIAFVWLDDDRGILLNEELIRLGCAAADHDAHHLLEHRFAAQETSARRTGVGIWAADHVPARRGH